MVSTNTAKVTRTSKKLSLTPRQLALETVHLGLQKKAFNAVILDVRPWRSVMDFIVLLSGGSTKQSQTIARHIQETLKQSHIYAIGTEGFREGKWILIDFGEVIIHVFFEYVRDIYDLEAFWQHAARLSIPKRYYKS